MDDQLRHLLNHGLEVRGIQVGGGLCEPASYLGACRQVAEALVAVGLLDRGAADATLPQIEARVQAAGATCRQQVAQAGWKGRQVLCSAHQEAFCKWLGLEVPATFSGSDASSIGDIEGAIQQGARHRVQLIIANLPEGRRLADALGSRLGVPIIVFGNFPLMRPEQASFDDLLATNVGELIQAAKQ